MISGEAAAGFQRIMDALAVADIAPSTGPTQSKRNAFEIRVTTADGATAGHPHQVVVGGDDFRGPAWIHVVAGTDLTSRLADSWKKACHVS